jgi:DNA-binding MarR family transcriptional regulator
MDRRLELIKQLLPQVDAFVKADAQGGVDDFIAYLHEMKELKPDRSAAKRTVEEENEASAIALMNSYQDHGASLAFHLNRLGKYAKYYVKEGFKGTALINADDFGFLASVMEHKEISKSALIAYNVHEIPSGMEVIRRLIKKGLLQERVNKDDRRVKMISATELGQATFFEAMQRMRPIAQLVCGKLSDSELEQLNALLGRLDHFHEQIYLTQKDENIAQIIETHL